MKTKPIHHLLFVLIVSLFLAPETKASTDYPPAVWTANCGQFYTSGSAHDFQVLHSLEGYYLASITYFQNCSTTTSLHYLVNGKKDASSDHAAGEITQMVREAYWAWHAGCWYSRMYGTGHEGFISSPAWLTTPLYTESAALTRHLADVHAFAKDRNHIVSDDQSNNSAWVTWVVNHYGFNPTCYTGIGLGSYWDWSKYMSNVKGTTVDNTDAGFTASASWLTATAATAFGTNYRYHSTAAISDPATWSASLSPAGKYQVNGWWPQAANFSAAAPYIISTSTGSQTIYVNQQVNGGDWNVMGTFSLSNGTNTVKLSCWAATGYVVAADAVHWYKVSDF